MKKIIIAAIACIAGTTFVKAQTTKGTLFIGTSIGSTSYSSVNDDITYPDGNYSNENRKASGFGITPAIGVFLTDHFILGGSLDGSYTHTSVNDAATEGSASSSTTKSNTSVFKAGPFVRYYFFNTTPSKTLVYLEAGGTIGTGSGSSTGSVTTPGDNYTSNGKMSGIFSYDGTGSIGITHFIQKNIGLDVALGYVYEHEKYTDTHNISTSSTQSTYDVTDHTKGVTLSAGFHFFIPESK